MRIATWNVERLKHKSELHKMRNCCKEINADILVLTETDRQLEPEYPYIYRTRPAMEAYPDMYRESENRVTVFSRYKCVRSFETFDKYTALCMELETEQGNLIVYGTIMGIFGNREKTYMRDLTMQMEDMKRLSCQGAVCLIGDYNCSLSDEYYYTKRGRNLLLQGLKDCGMSVLTESCKECIDHIAISEALLKGSKITVEEWNCDKSLSDHKGIVADIKLERN